MKPNPDQSPEDFNTKSLAYFTHVATPEGDRLIQDFRVGDSVLAFSAKLESGKIKLTSSNAKVSFSDGSSTAESFMILINLERVEDLFNEILCTPDLPFLLSNGKYSIAESLQIGQELVDKDGNPVKITNLNRGYYRNGYHSIATDAPDMHNPDGHLILVNGVIIGDYLTQVSQSFD